MTTSITRRIITTVAGFVMAGIVGVAAAPVATADQVYPYSTSPYFGGQVYVSTAPGNITIRAVQTTIGSFPYGCWANARNMEGNWDTGSRPLVQLFPRIWQVSFDGLPSGRYEVMQRCADGTSLIREREVIVELGGSGQAVVPEEAKPFDPGRAPGGTCSERISRIFSSAGIPTQLAFQIIDGLKGPGIETSFQVLCGAIESDPAAFCRALQAQTSLDLAFGVVDGIYDEIDRLLGQQNSQDRDAIIRSWQGACSIF